MITFSQLGRYGRLGNQLFQIAATIGIAASNNDTAAFPEWYCKYTKKRMSPFFKNPINENLPGDFAGAPYREPSFYHTPVSYTGDLNLYDSYFQSEKYFKHCDDVIRWHFAPSEGILKKITEKYGELLASETCSIHVRLGDYANNALHNVCGIDYYRRAIDIVKRGRTVKKFLVFSDNIQWCRDNFPGDFFFFVENNLTGAGTESIYRINDSDVEEMFLMSMCKHNIIANSSFSWWASWLNTNKDKVVIAPARWFSTEELDTRDLYTKEMIRV